MVTPSYFYSHLVSTLVTSSLHSSFLSLYLHPCVSPRIITVADRRREERSETEPDGSNDNKKDMPVLILYLRGLDGTVRTDRRDKLGPIIIYPLHLLLIDFIHLLIFQLLYVGLHG